jgi:hypothetical protein
MMVNKRRSPLAYSEEEGSSSATTALIQKLGLRRIRFGERRLAEGRLLHLASFTQFGEGLGADSGPAPDRDGTPGM